MDLKNTVSATVRKNVRHRQQGKQKFRLTRWIERLRHCIQKIAILNRVSGKLSAKTLWIFCQQFAILLTSGMTLTEALILSASGMREKKFRNQIHQTAAAIQKGKTLKEAINEAGCFPALFREMMGVAEETGGISEILTALSDYYHRQDQLRTEILQVTLYPVMVLILSVVIVIFLLTKIVPIFTEIIESLSGEVPLMTRILIQIGSFLSKGWLILIPTSLIYILFKWMMSRNPALNEKIGLLKLKLPIIGSFLTNHACMQISHALALLLKGGVNLPEGLCACKAIVGNFGLSAALEKTFRGVIGGRSLIACMTETAVFPDELCQMIRVGEETGSLTDTLEKASDYFRGNFNRQTKMLTTLLEPAVLIFVGLMVLMVMLAMMQPIYQVYESYVTMM